VTAVIAFDVNETLLDLSALDEPFEQTFGDAAMRQQWFALMLQVSFVGGLTDGYIDFSAAQHAAFLMLAERLGVGVTDDDASSMVERMSSLPAHPEAAAALQRLRDTDLTVVALTNSVASVAEAQLTNAAIREHFDGVMSADSVAHLKPAPQPYARVAEAYRVGLGEVRLVAAHWWDVAGAMRAGCQAAFVARPAMVLSPAWPRPDIVEADLTGVVRRIVELDVATPG
jgi:2-haloacid dehalogenase